MVKKKKQKKVTKRPGSSKKKKRKKKRKKKWKKKKKEKRKEKKKKKVQQSSQQGGHQKTACIRDGQFERKVWKNELLNNLRPRKNRACQAGDRLPPNKMVLANSYQMGNNPPWLGIRTACCAAPDKTPA
ncbi:hypothetical protein llap_15514 [Limosa lapponica baueri]|uniref:Uncharacterized protein n=1 Tax=Limosa lapponica baueri TaxID=1758121 RepID=A0A2I0TKC3_LIMLA|nr:hypothetical protein llap_15514 [Limosa lapponica baueri]